MEMQSYAATLLCLHSFGKGKFRYQQGNLLLASLPFMSLICSINWSII